MGKNRSCLENLRVQIWICWLLLKQRKKDLGLIELEKRYVLICSGVKVEMRAAEEVGCLLTVDQPKSLRN